MRPLGALFKILTALLLFALVIPIATAQSFTSADVGMFLPDIDLQKVLAIGIMLLFGVVLWALYNSVPNKSLQQFFESALQFTVANAQKAGDDYVKSTSTTLDDALWEELIERVLERLQPTPPTPSTPTMTQIDAQMFDVKKE